MSPQRCAKHPDLGFSLLELMIAITITAVIGLISANILTTMIANHDQVKTQQKELASLERALQVIRSDIEQLAIRPKLQTEAANTSFTTISGNSPLIGDQSSIELSVFVNQPTDEGINNTIHRVRYVVENSRLIRESINSDFPAANQRWQRTMLLNEIENLYIEYYFSGWESSMAHNNKPPKALRLTLESNLWQNIQLIVTLPEVDQ